MSNKKEKNIVEEALEDIKVIEEALQKNTKEILRSTMHEEIDAIVKEFITEENGYEEDDVETDTDDVETDVEDVTDTDVDIDVDDDNGEVEADADTEIEFGDETGESGEELPMGIDEPETDIEPEMDYDEMDMTAASDEEVIKVFKKLSAEDEIEIVSDTEVKITDPDSGNEYTITLGGQSASTDMESEIAPEMGDETDTEDDFEFELSDGNDDDEFELEGEENIYEITLAEDIVRDATSDIETSMTGDMPSGDIEGQTAEKSDVIDGDNLTGGFDEKNPNPQGDAHETHVMEGEIDEEVEEEDAELEENKSRAQPDLHANRVRPDGKKEYHTAPIGRADESVSKKKFNELLSVSKKLQTENKEIKKALSAFRKMLAESVVYNTNLTYMVKIITEHSTSKEEKQDIMKRFDEVTTLKESKSLYKTINGEFATKKPITESIVKKIESSQSSGSSSKLNSTTAYVDESTVRIKDLISRVENKDKY